MFFPLGLGKYGDFDASARSTPGKSCEVQLFLEIMAKNTLSNINWVLAVSLYHLFTLLNCMYVT